ncbi:MAG: hypothetical protein H0W12_00080 [Chitinophagaceae bacterium]|nr:hypothetical protein [Chitinophagaceae bacterium]
MKKTLLISVIFCSMLLIANRTTAQLDLNNLDVNSILGKIMNVQRGYAPKFALGDISIKKIHKVAEVLGLKKNDEVNRLFSTFNTGRTIYKITSFAGSAIAIYGIVKKISDSANVPGGKTALTSGLISVGSGLLVKFLTKAASYKAVSIFNGIATRKIKDRIKDIFSIAPASNTMGIGLYVKLD